MTDAPAAGEAPAPEGAYGTTTQPAPHTHSTGRPPRVGNADRLGDLRSALGVVGVLTVLGFPVGVVWALATPRVEMVRVERGFGLAEENPSEYIAGDAIFALMGFGLGVAAALTVWLTMRRRRGPLMLTALTVGSLACQTAAWRFGRMGRGEYEDSLDRMQIGWRFWRANDLLMVDFNPMAAYARLSAGDAAGMFEHLALGVLATMAFAAVFTYTLCAGWSRYSDLRTGDIPAPRQETDAAGDYVVSHTPAPESRNAAEVDAGGRLSS